MNKKYGFGIASLVLGICSLIFAAFAILWIPALIGLILAVLGLIFAILARKGGNTSGISSGGLVTSIIGLIVCAIFSIACSAAFLAGAHFIDTHASDIESALESNSALSSMMDEISGDLDQLSGGVQNTFE